MKNKTIYYHPNPTSITSVEDLHIPIKVDLNYSEKTIIQQCPVWNHQSSRTFTVYAASNLHLQIDADKVYSSNLTQEEFDNCIVLADGWNAGKFPIIQIGQLFSNFYWTNDKGVWISILPHPLTSLNNNFYHCGGCFNLSNWDREINIGAVVVDKNKPVVINRGDPLYNIKFYTNNHNDNFDLIFNKIDYDRYTQSKKRAFFVLSKRLSSGFNYQSIIFESEKKSKCPFRFFWKK